MKIERCPRGHFFDGDRYDACPLCPPEPAAEPSCPPVKEHRPTVGWLVCTREPRRGLDFPLHAGYNYIGSDPASDIFLPWEQSLGAESGGVLCYDEELRVFSFGPQGRAMPVRVGGKMIMDAVVIHPGDRLTVGGTPMLFVPLCGPDFSWETSEET